MAEILKHESDGIIEMDGTHDGPQEVYRAAVTSIVVSGSTAGVFEVKLNNTTFSIVTASAKLTEQVMVNMWVNKVELVAAPAGGKVYLTLAQVP